MTSPLTYEAFRFRDRILALDGVRACAVIGVLLHHTPGNPFARLHGFRGVSVFFVLSGFLITTLALREEAATGQLNLRAFAIRRAFRIMPLFYLALSAYVVWACVFHLEEDASLLWHSLPYYVLYSPEFPVFHYHFTLAFGQAWSLGIEEKFYLVWPALAFWLLARSQHRVLITVGLLAITAALTAESNTLAQMWGSYADILVGCLLALLLQDRSVYGYLQVLGRPAGAYLALGLLGVALLSPLTGSQLGERLFSMAGAIAIAALVMNNGLPAALTSNPWLVRIGAWSYAIYLTHPMVFDAVDHFLPGRRGHYLALPLTLAVDLPLCALLHQQVERPLIRLGRRVALRYSDSTSKADTEVASRDGVTLRARGLRRVLAANFLRPEQ